MDNMSSAQRSRVMASIRSKNTGPEWTVRRGLFALGFRYRLHDRQLPGAPDLVLPKHKAVIFVHGCFWHGHDCRLFKWPKSNREYWCRKIGNNQERDARNQQALLQSGWRVLTIWECCLRGKEANIDEVIAQTRDWLLKAESSACSLPGANVSHTV